MWCNRGCRPITTTTAATMRAGAGPSRIRTATPSVRTYVAPTPTSIEVTDDNYEQYSAKTAKIGNPKEVKMNFLKTELTPLFLKKFLNSKLEDLRIKSPSIDLKDDKAKFTVGNVKVLSFEGKFQDVDEIEQIFVTLPTSTDLKSLSILNSNIDSSIWDTYGNYFIGNNSLKEVKFSDEGGKEIAAPEKLQKLLSENIPETNIPSIWDIREEIQTFLRRFKETDDLQTREQKINASPNSKLSPSVKQAALQPGLTYFQMRDLLFASIPRYRKALVLGVNYESSPLLQLPSALDDARAVYDVFRQKGYFTTMHLNKSYEDMKAVISQFKTFIQPDDQVVFYFVGYVKEDYLLIPFPSDEDAKGQKGICIQNFITPTLRKSELRARLPVRILICDNYDIPENSLVDIEAPKAPVDLKVHNQWAYYRPLPDTNKNDKSFTQAFIEITTENPHLNLDHVVDLVERRIDGRACMKDATVHKPLYL